MKGAVKIYWRFFLVSLFLLFLSFSVNLFGAVTPNDFNANFKDSERLVVNQIVCRGSEEGGQLLVQNKKSEAMENALVCEPESVVAYSSQFGLQGRLYTLLYGPASLLGIGPRGYVALAQLLTAFFSAAVFGLLALWVRTHFSTIVGMVFVLLVAVSPMIVGLGRNLYWALPLMILPLVYTLWAYKIDDNSKSSVTFWAVIGLLLYIRFLAGYEFITTITIMVASAIAYHLFMARRQKMVYIREFTIVLAVAMVGFFAALGTHIYALQWTEGSVGKAASIVKATALNRTANTDVYLQNSYEGFKSGMPEIYITLDSYLGLDGRSESGSELWASIVSVLHYSALPVYKIPIALNQPLASYVQSITAFLLLLVGLYITKRRWVKKESLHQVDALFVAGVVGFVAYLSWLILARSHSLVHPHVNGILMYMPFALFGYIIIGLAVEDLLQKIRRLRHYER